MSEAVDEARPPRSGQDQWFDMVLRCECLLKFLSF
jgi:hypothetical protein